MRFRHLGALCLSAMTIVSVASCARYPADMAGAAANTPQSDDQDGAHLPHESEDLALGKNARWIETLAFEKLMENGGFDDPLDAEYVREIVEAVFRYSPDSVKGGLLALHLVRSDPDKFWGAYGNVSEKRISATCLLLRLDEEFLVYKQSGNGPFVGDRVSDEELFSIAQNDGEMHIADKYGFTASEWALAHGRLQLLSLLRMAGAQEPVDWGIAHQATALDAVQAGDLDRLRRAMALGLDVNRRFAGWTETVLQLAEEAGSPEMVRLLHGE